jgi:uncharacterized membrane protein
MKMQIFAIFAIMISLIYAQRLDNDFDSAIDITGDD